MSKSTAVLRLVDTAPPLPANVVRLPNRGARAPRARETLRLCLRREVTTVEIEHVREGARPLDGAGR